MKLKLIALCALLSGSVPAYSQGTIQVGYTLVTATGGTGVPASSALFTFTNNSGVLVSQAGVPATAPMLSGRILVDELATETALALVNPSNASASIGFVLRDALGNQVGEETRDLGPGQHLALFVAELFPEMPAGLFGSLTFTSDQALSPLALRQTINKFGEPLYATLPVVDLTTAAGSDSVIFPHLAAGQGYTTQLLLVNETDDSITGTVQLNQSDGSPLVLRLGSEDVSSFAYQLAPAGVTRVELGHPTTLTVGYAVVVPDAGQVSPAGTVIFQFKQDGQLITEAAVAATPLTTKARVFVDTVATETGLAVANTGSQEQEVTLALLDRYGVSQEETTRIVPAGGHFAILATELFPSITLGFTGQIEVRSSEPFAAVTLKLTINSRGELVLTTLPVGDAVSPQSAASIVFPQIAIGGGFSTRFVFLHADSSNPADGQLQFFLSDGSMMLVPLAGEEGSQFPYSFTAGEARRFFPGNTDTIASITLRDGVSNEPTEEVHVNLGMSLGLRVLVVDSSGTSRDDFAVGYSSLNLDIARVDATGNILGLDSGFSTLTMTAGNLIAAATITVTDVDAGVAGFEATGVTQDASGTLYLASSQSHTVLVSEDLTQAPAVFAGIQDSPGLKNGVRTEAQFSSPTYLSFGSANGEIYVSDSANHTIRRIAAGLEGQVDTLAGNGMAGSADGSEATFDTPQGIALDDRGNMWVVDSGNHTIRRINLETGDVETLAGSPGNAGLVDGTGSAALFDTPTGIALEVESLAEQLARELTGDPPPPIRMLVTDTNNNVIRRVWETGVVETVTSLGSNSALQAGGAGLGSRIDSIAAALRFSSPAGIASDAIGNIYVTEPGQNQVQVILPDGGTTLLAQRNTFQEPRGVVITADGKVLVSDRQSLARSIGFGAPTIESISPDRVLNTGGDTVTVSGTNFAPGSLVLVGRIQISATVESSNRITFAVPAVPSGLRTLTILDRGGTAQTPLWVDAVPLDQMSSGNITTVAGGSDFVGDGLKGRQAALAWPFSTAFAPGGLLIVDRGNHRIRRYDWKTAVVTTIAGTGDQESSGDGGPAVAASLNAPTDAVVDWTTGNIFVAELGGHRIRMIGASTGIISTIAGTGQAGFSGDGGPALDAQMNQPIDMALDAEGRLLVAESANHVIRRIDLSDGTITTVVGTGVRDFGGDGGPAPGASLNGPRGIAVDASGNLFIADGSNNRIRRVDAGAATITTIAGTGEEGFSGDGGPATSAVLNWPGGVAVDVEGSLYFADRLNHVIRRIDAETGFISTIAGNGMAGFDGDNGPGTEGLVNRPAGVTVTRSGGLIIIADTLNNRVRRWRPRDDLIRTFVGNGAARIIGDDGPATAAGLYIPNDLLFDPSGNLLVADLLNHRVRSIDAGSGSISTIAGGGDEGLVFGAGSGGFADDDGPALGASLNQPSGISIDTEGDLAIADARNDHIRVAVAATGNIRSIAGADAAAVEAYLFRPRGVAYDSAGNLYLTDTDNNKVRRIDRETGAITTVAGTGERGFSGDGAAAVDAALNRPWGLAFDAADNLYIADAFNNRIRRIDAGTGLITTVAGSGAVGRDPTAFGGDEGRATEARLSLPLDVTVDTDGNLWIADLLNNRVRFVNGASGIITTVAGSGLFGSRGSFSGDNGPATSATLAFPRAVVVDENGNLYIATQANRIRAVRAPLD